MGKKKRPGISSFWLFPFHFLSFSLFTFHFLLLAGFHPHPTLSLKGEGLEGSGDLTGHKG